jgi:hypothetical protein
MRSSARLLPASQSGQVGIIIILIMVTLMTIGLSVATRTTQDLSLSQAGSESARVFNAAESGVEAALSTDLEAAVEGVPVDVTSFAGQNVDVTYTVSKLRQLETRVFEGVTVEVDVTGVTTGQLVNVDWSRENDCTNEDPASIMVAVYYDDSGTTRVRYYGLGACAKGDNFDLASNISIDGYRRRSTLTMQTGDKFMRIKPVYNDTHLRVAANGWTMPVQYYNIRAEARSTLSDETRIVEVNRTLPTAPSVMDFALYSNSTLNK